jgi:Glycosyl transferases group 1
MRRRKINLLIASHPNSGYSMIKTSQLIERCINQFPGDNLVLRPTSKISQKFTNYRAKKYLRYVELLLIFPLKIMLTRVRFSINQLMIIDHSDAIHLFYFPRNTAITIVHDQFAYMASQELIPNVNIKLAGRIYQKIIHKGLRRSRKLLAVSNYTKEILIGLNLNQQIKILNLTWNPWPQTSEAFPESFEANKLYGILVSPRSWRKDRIYSIETLNALRQFTPFKELQLIIVGDDLGSDEIINASSTDLSFIRVVKNITEAQLKWLYENSLFCIATSKYEGYGLPIIEANSLGITCLHNQIPSFMEISNRHNVLLTNNVHDNNWFELVQKLLGMRASKKLALETNERFGLEIFSSNLKMEFFS